MQELEIFKNEEFGTVRTILIDNEPWFVGKDVAEILGYENPQKAIRDHVYEDDAKMGERNVTPSVRDSIGREQFPTFINESGMYALIFGSRKESAQKFKRWVTGEVIPQIRKTGGYRLPQTYQEALRALADRQDELDRLAKQNAELIPKAEFFDAVTDSKTAISIGEVAKVLDMGIGQNKLFAFLREQKILDRQNIPYQEYIDRGYFRIVEQKYEVRGEVRINIKTLVFQKGIDWIRKQLQKEDI